MVKHSDRQERNERKETVCPTRPGSVTKPVPNAKDHVPNTKVQLIASAFPLGPLPAIKETRFKWVNWEEELGHCRRFQTNSKLQ